MKRKIITAFLLLSLGIICMTYNNSNKTLSDNNKVINVKIDQDSIKSYNNIESLKTDAEIIVKGEVLKTNSYVSDSMGITEYTLKVDKSYNDNAKEGDLLTIATAGGTVNFSEYEKYNKDNVDNIKSRLSEKELKNSKLNFTFKDYDLVEVNKEYIIFANTQTVLENNIKKDMYCSLNVGDGQFEIKDDSCLNKNLKYNDSIDNFEKQLSK